MEAVSIICVYLSGATHVKTTKGFVGKVCDFNETFVVVSFDSHDGQRFDVPFEKIEEAWFDPNWRNWIFKPEDDLDKATRSYMHFSSVLLNCEFSYSGLLRQTPTIQRMRNLWTLKRDMIGY